MQFKVPQFLEIEDKIFGPFTFREFVYLAGGAGICFMLYKLMGFIFGAIPILAVAGFSLALTFYKPNNKPFLSLLESGFKYLLQSKLYIWRRQVSRKQKEQAKMKSGEKGQSLEYVPARLNSSKLRDLAWSLDVLDSSKQNTGD